MGLVPKAVAVAMLALVALSFAEDFVAVNSHDGRDVLSGIFYANVKGFPVRFMPSAGGSSDVFTGKVGTGKSVLLIQSPTNPISGFVESDLKAAGNAVEPLSSSNALDTNLELAKRSGAQKFIIVDSAYSDSAITAIPYAAATKSYVIFADSTNIAQVKSAVAGKEITFYGYVDSKVKSALSQYSPKSIGTGEDKYADNVLLVGMLMDGYGMDRPVMTDGSVIEDSIADGKSPVLLTGRLVPDVTYGFIKERVASGKLAGVFLVGNDLVSPVYDMREKIKNEFRAAGQNKTFSIMIKFAQAIPSAQSGVLGLDIFRVPAYKPSIAITEVSYNKENGKVMIGLENTGEGPLYFSLDLKVLLDGQDFRTFGESDAVLIERGDSYGLEYPLDLSAVEQGALTTSALVKFGSTKSSLEEYTVKQGSLETITYTDTSNVTVKAAAYDKGAQMLKITIKNNGGKTAYAIAKATLIDEDGVPTRISGAGIRELEPYSIYVEEIPLIMSDKEISLNRQVAVSVEYGGRRGFLVNTEEYTVALDSGTSSGGMEGMLMGALAIIILAIIVYAAYRLLAKKKQ